VCASCNRLDGSGSTSSNIFAPARRQPRGRGFHRDFPSRLDLIPDQADARAIDLHRCGEWVGRFTNDWEVSVGIEHLKQQPFHQQAMNALFPVHRLSYVEIHRQRAERLGLLPRQIAPCANEGDHLAQRLFHCLVKVFVQSHADEMRRGLRAWHSQQRPVRTVAPCAR